MFNYIAKKIFRNNAKESEEKDIDKKIGELKNFFKKSNLFIDNLLSKFKDESKVIIEKCKNLLDTNYKLGMKHLEDGNLNDAIFRFRFIKKFWPDFHEAYCKLAYCLSLKGNNFEAKRILLELLEKDPTNEDGNRLLNQIKTSEINDELSKLEDK